MIAKGLLSCCWVDSRRSSGPYEGTCGVPPTLPQPTPPPSKRSTVGFACKALPDELLLGLSQTTMQLVLRMEADDFLHPLRINQVHEKLRISFKNAKKVLLEVLKQL